MNMILSCMSEEKMPKNLSKILICQKKNCWIKRVTHFKIERETNDHLKWKILQKRHPSFKLPFIHRLDLKCLMSKAPFIRYTCKNCFFCFPLLIRRNGNAICWFLKRSHVSLHSQEKWILSNWTLRFLLTIKLVLLGKWRR